MSDAPDTHEGEQFDDPNREAVGLPPIWTPEAGDGDPDPEPEPEAAPAKKARKAEAEDPETTGD